MEKLHELIGVPLLGDLQDVGSVLKNICTYIETEVIGYLFAYSR